MKFSSDTVPPQTFYMFVATIETGVPVGHSFIAADPEREAREVRVLAAVQDVANHADHHFLMQLLSISHVIPPKP